MSSIRSNLGNVLHRAGISADALTWGGLAAATVAGWLAFDGRFLEAATALLVAGIFDLLDGSVARAGGKAGPVGGVLDSSLDRYGDGFIFAGLILYFAREGSYDLALWGFSALFGSFLVSYVRARGECEVDDCRIGFWERGERIVFLCLGLALGAVPAALWVLGTGTHLTAFTRFGRARRAILGRPEPKGDPWTFLADNRRTGKPYLAKAAFFVLVLIFARLTGIGQ